ncbi:MAG: replication factor C large subunit [archaeon]
MRRFQEKYTPKKFEEFIGNNKAIAEIKLWARNPKKPLFLSGETGVGKTLAANIVAKENDWSIITTDASDIRNKEALQNLIEAAQTTSTLFLKKRLILIDEVDAIEDKRGSQDYGSYSELLKLIEISKHPLIFIANDPYENKKVRPIFDKCLQVKFDLPNKLSILKFAKDICEKENVEYDLVSLKELVERANNDIRAMLIDLHGFVLTKKITLEDVNNLGSRKRTEDVYKALSNIFYPKGFFETREVLDKLNIDYETLLLWVDENIPRQYKSSKNILNAFNYLGKADLYSGRIKAHNWILLKYVIDYLTVGVAYCKTESEIRTFTPFVYPSLISGMGSSKGERAIRKSIVEKLQTKIHASKHIIYRDYLPIISIIASTNKYNDEYIKNFEFTSEELKLLGAKVTSKTIKEYN